MMADFVNQDVCDKMLEGVLAIGPLVENGSAEQSYPVRQSTGLVDAFLPNGDAFIDAGQDEWVLDLHRFKGFVVGEFLNEQHDMFEVRGEGFGKALHRATRDRLDLLG